MTETEIETTSSKFATAKSIARFAASRAVSGTVVTLVHQNIDMDDFTRMQRVAVYVGAYMIGSKVADVVVDHMEERVDSMLKLVTELRKDNSDTEIETDNPTE